MINLIPNEEKKKKVKDFYFRLSVVFFSSLGFAILVASATLLPAYFLSVAKKNLVNDKLETQKNQPVSPSDQEIRNTASALKIKLNLLDEIKQSNKYIVTEMVVNEVILKKMPDIKITEIAYDNSNPKGKAIRLNGIAPSRERLLLFRRALEDDVAFKSVNLPISSFVKGANIEFTLNLVPNAK